MKQFIRRTMLLLAATASFASTLGAPAGGSAAAGVALDSQAVELSCSDGTLLQLTLGMQKLNALSSAVAAIGLYPAGDPPLTCTLSRLLGLSASRNLARLPRSSSASGNANTNYAVGGGRATLFGCEITPIAAETNFGLSAHVDAASNGTGGRGTFNVTVPQSEVAACPEEEGGGHFNGKVDCVLVAGSGPGTAQATFRVTHASGSLAVLEGAELRVDVFDSGVPGGTGDTIELNDASGPCDFTGYRSTRPVDNGNISVHQAP